MAARALDAADVAPLDALRSARASQIEQVSALRRQVEAAGAARDSAAAEVRALEYVCDLTRDEVARRRRGNQRLARAYSGEDELPDLQDPAQGDTVAVQRTETALLAAKAELAALRLSIDELHARRARAARARAAARRRHSSRPGGRLIADVDAIVVVGDDAAPARLGVAPAGAVTLLGYDSAEPVRRLPPPVNVEAPVELAEPDVEALHTRMRAAPVLTTTADRDEKHAVVVGIADALSATVRLVNTTSTATTVVDDPLPPPSPHSPRRPLSLPRE